MALPTLQPFYQRGKTPSEAGRIGMLVSRRAREADLKQTWSEHQKYLQNNDLRSLKQEAWVSFPKRGGTPHTKADDKLLLHERRIKLQRLLEQEKTSLESELVEMSKDRTSVMRSRTDELKTKRESREKEIAKQKLHDHWQTNCPELRQLRSKHMQLAVKDEWEEQMQLKELERDAIKTKEESYQLVLEEERLAALALEEERKLKHQVNAKQYANKLLEQIDVLKTKEKEAEVLERKQHALYQEQLELDIAQKERKALEDKQTKLEFGRILLRQHKANLRQKGRQAQEALELDMKILETLSKKEEEEQMVLTSRKKRAQEDVEWMKETFARQLEIEKRRESELDILYQEEAARIWHKREAEWKKEQVAREKLMQEVFAERQQQVIQRLSKIKEMQAVSVQEREKLLKQIEQDHQLSSRDLIYKEHRQAQHAHELQKQISVHKERVRLAHEQEEEASTQQRALENEYEDLVKLEEGKIVATGFQPKSHARRKVAWW